MDGLLIDSEPLWKQAGEEILAIYDVLLSEEQYHSSTGLRTPEWIDRWFTHFGIDSKHAPVAISNIERTAIEKITLRGNALPGVSTIFQFFSDRQFQIGLASSSPMRLIERVVEKLAIGQYLHAITSAEALEYGKPHPQVFLNCAQQLNTPAGNCLVFEDSFNGMIAAKAAKMKCVVIPEAQYWDSPRWGAADLKLRSLEDFTTESLLALS